VAGVRIASSGNTVGGASAADRNVISGNGAEGVRLSGPSNRIEGNYIGTDAAGTSALPNAGDGVLVAGAGTTAITIGGATAAERNVISGNGGSGIRLENGTWGDTIRGNYVGVDAGGAADLGNALSGVFILNSGADDPASGILVVGNVISTNGDPAAAATGAGVLIRGLNARGNRVQGNKVGTDAGGTARLGNDLGGIAIDAGAHDNLVGGTGPGAGNLIAFNPVGVVVAGVCANVAPVRNRISRNAIFGNGGGRMLGCNGGDVPASGLGIDLGGDGVTANDSGDGDSGPNELMNFPVILQAVSSSTKLTIGGMIDTANPASVTIELFANAFPSPGFDPSGYGEGAVFLGTATPAASGKWSASFAPVPSGTIISATATDANGDTSEFARDAVAK
jgi:hypothetical protein